MFSKLKAYYYYFIKNDSRKYFFILILRKVLKLTNILNKKKKFTYDLRELCRKKIT